MTVVPSDIAAQVATWAATIATPMSVAVVPEATTEILALAATIATHVAVPVAQAA